MKKPALRARKGDASLRYDAMTFHTWPIGELCWWALAFLAFASFAGNLGNQVVAGYGFLVLAVGLVYLVFGRRRRLLLLDGSLIHRVGFAEERWKWSELSTIRLDHSRLLNRPVISFQTKAGGRAYLWGPWNADEITVHTAVRLAKERCGRTDSLASSN